MHTRAFYQQSKWRTKLRNKKDNFSEPEEGMLLDEFPSSKSMSKTLYLYEEYINTNIAIQVFKQKKL